MQAWWFLQSVFKTHSGWHPVLGSPIKFVKHEHTGLRFWILHSVLIPHGLGKHGFPVGAGSEPYINK